MEQPLEYMELQKKETDEAHTGKPSRKNPKTKGAIYIIHNVYISILQVENFRV